MRKLTIVVMIQILCAVGLAQQPDDGAPKPSKEVTMNWLAEKLKANLTADRKFVSYYNGVFKYRNNNRWGYCYFTIDFNKITKVKYGGSSCKYIGVAGTKFRGRDCVLSVSEDQLDYFDTDTDYWGTDTRGFGAFEFCNEENLGERILKALRVLVDYNLAKNANEPF